MPLNMVRNHVGAKKKKIKNEWEVMRKNECKG